MGMSSSQARLLTLSARMHDIEWRAQKIEADKLRLANDSRHAYEDYLRVLDAKKIQYRALNPDGSVTFRDATLAALENSLVSTYSGETSSKAFFLQDVKSGAIYISKDFAEKMGITGDSMTYSGTLTQWLTENDAPKKVVNITTVGNRDFVNYTPDYYTYEKAVPNTSEKLPNVLLAGHTYTVSTADDLVHLSNLANSQDTTGVTIILGSDIDMGSVTGFISLGSNSDYAFKGTFDGNGHTISNINKTIFNNIDGATIKNLNVSGNITSSTDRAILINNAKSSTIEDIIISGSVRYTGTSSEGAGTLIATGTDITVNRCQANNVNVKIDNPGDSSYNDDPTRLIAGQSGGLIGQIYGNSSGSKITNCSSSGYVESRTAVGGLIGKAWNNTVITNCSSTAEAKSNQGNNSPGSDVGGFIGVARNGVKISNCYSTGDASGKSACGGFIGSVWGWEADTTCGVEFDNCYSTGNVICTINGAGGFIGDGNYCSIDNCIATGVANSGGVDQGTFIAVARPEGYTTITNSWTTQSGNAVGSWGGLSATPSYIGVSTTSSPTLPTITVQPPELEHNTISPDAIPMVDVGKKVATIPYIDSTTGNGSYNSNILGVLMKSGKVNPAATEEDLADWNTRINDFLSSSNFSDNSTDNSKLYYLNQYIVSYLNDSNPDKNFADKLYNDLINGTTSQTASYQNGEVITSASRSEVNKAWTPTHVDLEVGKLTIPSKSTIQANIMAALKKAQSNILESKVEDFLDNYDLSSPQDLAYLAYINDLLANYSTNRGGISELINAISLGRRIEENPSYIDDVAHFNITMNKEDQSSLIVLEKDFDMDNEITKNLVIKYNTMKAGYIIIGDGDDAGMDQSTEWLTNMVDSGTAIILEYDYENASIRGNDVSVPTTTYLQEVQDEKELKKAEAKYEADMKRIDRKDRQYDTQLAACETERNAIKQEMETLKTVAKDNADRTFKLFS